MTTEPEERTCPLCYEPLVNGHISLCGQTQHELCLKCLDAYTTQMVFRADETALKCPCCRRPSAFSPISRVENRVELYATSFSLSKSDKRWNLDIAIHSPSRVTPSICRLPIRIHQFDFALKPKLTLTYLRPLFRDHILTVAQVLLARELEGNTDFTPVSLTWPGLFWRVISEHGSRFLDLEVRATLPSKTRRDIIIR